MPNLRTINNRQRSKASKGEFHNWYYGDVYQSCSYHPLRMVEISFYGHGDGSIKGVSVLDGSQQSCSLRHCGVYKMTDEEVEAHKIAWKTDGERGLMRINGWSDEGIQSFMEVWR